MVCMSDEDGARTTAQEPSKANSLAEAAGWEGIEGLKPAAYAKFLGACPNGIPDNDLLKILTNK